MATLFQKIWNSLKKKEVRHLDIDPEQIKKYETIKALSYALAEEKAKSQKLEFKELERKEHKEQQEKEDEIKYQLNLQKDKIEKKSYPRYFSFRKFFNKLRSDKNFRQKIGYYSFDGSRKLSKFEDIGLAEDNKIVLIGTEGEVILTADKPQDLFWSVGGLGTDVSSNKIPICVTPDGKYQENVMVWKPAKVVKTEEGKFQYSHTSKQPLYDYLAELNQQISELDTEIGQKEITIIGLTGENDKLKIAIKVNQKSAESSRANLSTAEKEVSEIKDSFRGIANELSKYRNTNSILEDDISKLETQLEKMIKEAERQGVKLSDNVAMDLIQRIRRELVRDEPERERIIEKPIETPKQIPQTGKK